MNIFEYYLTKISATIVDNKKTLKLENINDLKSVNLEVPPAHFNYDLSTNVSLVLSKANKIKPNILANDIKKILIKNINHFEKIDNTESYFCGFYQFCFIYEEKEYFNK
mgnify:CR=1 FL=1